MATDLPSQHRALVLESMGSAFKVEQRTTPQAHHGSAVVRILAANILSYHQEIYDGSRFYGLPTPIVGGKSSWRNFGDTGSIYTVLQTP